MLIHKKTTIFKVFFQLFPSFSKSLNIAQFSGPGVARREVI